MKRTDLVELHLYGRYNWSGLQYGSPFRWPCKTKDDFLHKGQHVSRKQHMIQAKFIYIVIGTRFLYSENLLFWIVTARLNVWQLASRPMPSGMVLKMWKVDRWLWPLRCGRSATVGVSVVSVASFKYDSGLKRLLKAFTLIQIYLRLLIYGFRPKVDFQTSGSIRVWPRLRTSGSLY